MILAFGFFSWWPILNSLILSFQQTNLVDPAVWVGLSNFAAVFADPLVAKAAMNTLWFTVLSVAVGFPLPILLAVAIGELRRTRSIASGFAYLPVIIPPVVSVLIFKQFYDPSSTGLLNTLLAGVGLGPVPWLQTAATVMPSIVIQATWAGFGAATIIYIAALAAVSPELYEAAELDGASIRSRVWHVTLPQMRSVMLIMLLLQIIGAFQVFTEPFVMTRGGPENNTLTILMLIYNYTFISGDYGRAAALSLILAAILALVSLLYLRATRGWSQGK